MKINEYVTMHVVPRFHPEMSFYDTFLPVYSQLVSQLRNLKINWETNWNNLYVSQVQYGKNRNQYHFYIACLATLLICYWQHCM